MKSLILGLILISVFLLNGCGGTSSTDGINENIQIESTKIGLIVDASIVGLRYISISPSGKVKRGITSSKGEFEYFVDGTTTFLVGDIEIGTVKPSKLVAITTIVENDIEKENIARFLQTIDSDNNPDNGINISSILDENAKNITSFDFGSNFEAIFESYKTQLLQERANTVSLVTSEQAVDHASKSERLSSIKEFDLYKAIANEKFYRGKEGPEGSEGVYRYYNAPILENDQRKRVYLWLWEKILVKEIDIANELATQDFDISKVEEERDRYKKYLDYAESVVSIASLGKGTFDNLSKAGTRTISYEISQLTSLTVGGCSAAVRLYDVNTNDSVELPDTDLCKNMMKVLNPVGDSTSKLAIANPILSGFLPQLLPKLVHLHKMNWLHFNTKSLRNLSKASIKKPDLISIGLSIAQIANDSAGAYRASNINQELTTRLVAKEWLSIWFRSGFKQEYMNKLINDNAITLIGKTAQIEAIALKWGTSDAFCDAYKFFNPFVDCSGIENINYDLAKVNNIINEYLSKSNLLYSNIVQLTGSLSNENSEIGVISVDWVVDEGLSDFENNTPTQIVQEGVGNDRDALITPNGGESWNNGENQTIYWMTQYITGSTVDLYVLHDDPSGLYDKTNQNIGTLINSKNWFKFSSSISNTGSYNLDPTEMSGTGNAYMVLVVSTENNSKFDISDSTFSLNQ